MDQQFHLNMVLMVTFMPFLLALFMASSFILENKLIYKFKSKIGLGLNPFKPVFLDALNVVLFLSLVVKFDIIYILLKYRFWDHFNEILVIPLFLAMLGASVSLIVVNIKWGGKISINLNSFFYWRNSLLSSCTFRLRY